MSSEECDVPYCDRPQYAHGLCKRDYDLRRLHPGDSPNQLAKRRRRVQTPDEIREKIRARVHITAAGCWEWQGAKLPNGYGGIRWAGKHWRVHRLAYHLFRSEVDPAVDVCHRCDNPPCCNPDHLFLGTHWENAWDAKVKGRLKGNGGRTGELNGRATLTEAQIREIRASTDRQVDLAKRYGVTQPTISAIRLRKVWKAVA